MHRLKAAVPLALAVGIATASPAAAESTDAHRAGAGPVARAAGSDAGPPIYPGLVNTRMIRVQKALDRATDYADDGNTDKARSALYVARLNTRLAWRGAKYWIQHAPPPPPGDGLRRVRIRLPRVYSSKARARVTGGAVGGYAVADGYTTAGGVLLLQHTVAQTAIGMIDSAHGLFRDSLSRTLFNVLDQRDAAVAYIHSIDTPPPPGDGLARASDAPADPWAAVMPGVGDQAGDESTQIEGALELGPTMGTGLKRVLRDADFQVIQTQRAINQYWPPVPGD